MGDMIHPQLSDTEENAMNRRRFLSAGAMGTLATLVPGTGATAATNNGYNKYAAGLRAPLNPDGGVAEMVRLATLAPNGHNTQAWKFSETTQGIAISPDMSRRTPVVDPDDHHLFISLGAALTNLEIAGHAIGRPGRTEIATDGSALYQWTAANPVSGPMTEAILQRQSTRAEFDARAIEPKILAQLERAASEPGVRLVILSEPGRIAQLTELILTANDSQMENAAFKAELKDWIRFNPEQAMASGDGLLTIAGGNPSLPGFVAPLLFDAFFSKKSERRKYALQMQSTPAVAIFLSDRSDPRNWVRTGMAAERMLLHATRVGLATAFVNQPVEVANYRADLADLAGEPGLRPDLIIRLGQAPRLPYSPRRPVSEVLS
ncbi:Acg family FMN-binding oxidoreductase [Pseudooceanicola sp. C21-150M6]|uniref:Acg family FMN-binding oxidoreductase n=1 Tax=Pseudooceanicola sp. C21-150M6 TaxID=3434355 RepID=UPI003D7F8EED